MASVLDANLTTTSYSYDVSNHLAAVSVGGQNRSFTYDNRGFLRSETHPENGTTIYGGYDARGHVGSKTVNNANTLFDLTYEYDGAERLLRIKSRNPDAPSTFRLSKELTYARSNSDSTNYTAGKVVTATRYNYEMPGSSAVTVTEKYDYRDGAGRLSRKITDISGINSSSATRSFEQDYVYNDLGLINEMRYPYPNFAGEPTWDWLFPRYTSGRFTGAKPLSYSHPNPPAPDLITGDITYWPNGMLHSIIHNNGVIDTYTMDSSTAMPRPSQITFAQWSAPSCTVPSITSQSAAASIFYGDSKTISVTATGDGLSYQWYTGQTLITGAATASYTVSSTQSASYWVRVANACGTTDSTAIAITVQLHAPVALVADRSGAGILISWQASAGATSYQVFRESGGVWGLISSPAASPFTDNNPPPGATLVYRVAAGRSGVSTSEFSNSNIESTLNFTNVTAGMTVTYAVFDELRNGLNAVRWASGDAPWSWAQVLSQQGCAQTSILPQPNGPIMAAHLLALRCVMDNTLQQRFGITSTAYTDPNLTGAVIKAVHVRELQQRTDYQGDNR